VTVTGTGLGATGDAAQRTSSMRRRLGVISADPPSADV